MSYSQHSWIDIIIMSVGWDIYGTHEEFMNTRPTHMALQLSEAVLPWRPAKVVVALPISLHLTSAANPHMSTNSLQK